MLCSGTVYCVLEGYFESWHGAAEIQTLYLEVLAAQRFLAQIDWDLVFSDRNIGQILKGKREEARFKLQLS